VKISVIFSILVIAESFGLLYVGFNYFHLAPGDPALDTFTFEILFYSAMFLIFNVREREHFWNSMPSKTLLTAILLSIVTGTTVSTVGIPGLKALPFSETLFVIFCSLVFSLILNDLVKFFLVKKTELRW
jgi:magnesium-transporting ATPase (P-type)